jgi:hypothetical protein
MTHYPSRLFCALIAIIFALCLVSPPAARAQDVFNTYESITVAGSSIGLSTSTYRPTGAAQMQVCQAHVETAELRYRIDGTAPTATEGIPLEPGDNLPLLNQNEIAAVRFIRTTSASAIVKVTCYRAPRPIQFGTSGVEYVRQDHPNRVHCTVAVSTATTIQAVGGSCAAPGAGLSLYITDIMFSSSAAGIAADAFPTLKYGTGGTCGTGTTVFWQALTAAAVIAVDNRSIPIKVPANNEICWITTTAGSKTVQVSGFIAP